MKSGPTPKPPELAALEGNRGHRAVDLSTMFRPAVGVPSIPKHLTAGARKAWKRLTPELLTYNLVSPIYRDALASLCMTIDRVELLERSFAARQAQLADEGRDPAEAFLASTPNGMSVQAPTYQILNREMDKLRNLLAEFGLTPAQCARVMPGVRQATTAQLHLFPGTPAQPAAAAQPAGFAEFQ